MSNSAIEKRFGDLEEILKSSGIPEWSSVFFVEDFYINPSSKQTLERSQLYSIAEYSDQFDSLISKGHGWLNMSGLGLLENDLIVSIEIPSQQSPSFSCGVPNTSVNYSGPMRWVEDRHYDLSTFIEVKE